MNRRAFLHVGDRYRFLLPAFGNGERYLLNKRLIVLQFHFSQKQGKLAVLIGNRGRRLIGIEELCRRALQLRYRLMPYLYAAFMRSAETGEPVQQPLQDLQHLADLPEPLAGRRRRAHARRDREYLQVDAAGVLLQPVRR